MNQKTYLICSPRIQWKITKKDKYTEKNTTWQVSRISAMKYLKRREGPAEKQ